MYGIQPGTPGIGSIRRGYVISPSEGFGVWTENNYRAEKNLPHRSYYLFGPWGDHGNDYIEP